MDAPLSAAALIEALAYGASVRGGMVRCPAHDDRDPSLHVSEVGGKVLLKCFAGCTQEQVITALKLRDLWLEGSTPLKAPRPRRVAETYQYTDARGCLLFEVVRYEPKTFRQRRPDPDLAGGWIWNLDGVSPVLYRLPRVWETAQAGGTVWLAEGEKDVHALEAAGVVATCNPMGAGKWNPDYSEALRGAHVVIVADRDASGRAHAAMVLASLDGVAASVRLVEAAEGKDAADHLAAEHSLDEFVPITLDSALMEEPEPQDTSLDDEVQHELQRMRVRDRARRLFAMEQSGSVEQPEVATLADLLERPRTVTEPRIAGWQPRNSRVLLAAQYKAGKTTLRDNLVRCLVDGAHWLGAAKVTPVEGTVVVFDDEMSQTQLVDWLADQSIIHPEQVIPISLRGRLGSFNIMDPDAREHWATILRDVGAEYVILDCLRPVMDAFGLDEHRDAGRVLVAFDAMLAAAGVPDGMIVHHMGHGQERSRGDSRLRDWPDVEWRLLRASDDPASARYITAFGRDVDVPESGLHYDPYSRRLTLEHGSRRDVAAAAALDAVLDLLRDAEPMSGRGIEQSLDGLVSRTDVRAALKLGKREGKLDTFSGAKRAVMWKCASAR